MTTKVNNPAPTVRIGLIVGFLAGWLALAVFNVVAIVLFGGWVGAADGFLPWSVFAAPLWIATRRELNLSPLRRSSSGRVLFMLWIVFVALAAAGIDERDWPISQVVVVVTYLSLPLLPVFLIAIAVARRRQGMRVT